MLVLLKFLSRYDALGPFRLMGSHLFLLSVANVGVNVLMAALRVFTLGGIFY